MFSSIRVRIILVYMALFTVVLFVFSVVLYQQLKRDLYSNMDDTLKSRAESIKKSIDTYWETEKLRYTKDGKPVGSLLEIEKEDFSYIAGHLLEEDEIYDPRFVKVDVEVFDRTGESMAHSKFLPYRIKIPEDAKRSALSGKRVFEDYIIELTENRKIDVRVYVRPVKEEETVVYLVQTTASLTALNGSINRLKIILFVLLPLSVLLTGVAAGFLTKFALKPVDEMISSARAMTGLDLKQRIHVPEGKDELRHLALVLNELFERLDHSVGAQKRFIQDATHELKTPLTAIKGQIEVAARRERSGREYRKILGSALDEINSLGKIIDDLLVLARFENKEIKLIKEPVDLYFVAAKAVKSLRTAASVKKVKLKLSGGSTLITGDERFLVRLALNLVDNAVKYTPAGGSVEVKTFVKRSMAFLSVKDSGAGINAKDLKHIFDRFYRADLARTEEGYGLGLSIVRSVAALHGGRVSVKSIPGKGSEFVFSLSVSINKN